MRIALLSDVHANLPALEAVLADIDATGVDATWHLGDLVGYAPWPNEVVDLLRARQIPGIAGNYDSTVGFAYKHCGCQYEDPVQEAQSHESFAWTCHHVTEATRAWLRALPFRVDVRVTGGHGAGPTLLLVHGTPTLNTVYWKADRSDEFCLKMAERAHAVSGDLVAFGHTHIPWDREVEGIHFVNTGSVGRPKDGDPRACWVLATHREGAWQIEHRRVAYDLDRAMTAIRSSTLPHDFAEYLASGGRPVPAPPA